MAWKQVIRLGVGGNYVCCLVIVVIFMGLGVNAIGGSHKVKGRGALFMGQLTPQVFYQNYLPISASFDLERVL